MPSPGSQPPQISISWLYEQKPRSKQLRFLYLAAHMSPPRCRHVTKSNQALKCETLGGVVVNPDDHYPPSQDSVVGHGRHGYLLITFNAWHARARVTCVARSR